MEQINFDCPDYYPDNLLSSQNDVNALTLPTDDQIATAANPLELEMDEFEDVVNKCTECGLCNCTAHLPKHSDELDVECSLCSKK